MTYPRRMITKTAFTPTGPNPTGSAPGIWRLDEVAYWIKQGVWPDATADQYWPYVSLLLSSTSLSNANNNLFVDSSGAYNPVSRNGNTTQGSFSPYATNWSMCNAVNASDTGIGVATNAALNLGTGDFTVECWVNLIALPTSNTWTTSPGGYQAIFATGPNSSATGSQLYIGTTNILFDVVSDGSGPISVAHGMSPGVWYHIALTRSGNTFRIFKNGALLQTGTDTNAMPTGYGWGVGRAEPLTFFSGGWLYGYLSNFRLVKGTAIYTAAFTPPASPLTAVSGTSLLLCQSNRFVDNSGNNFTVGTGTTTPPQIQDFGPFTLAAPGISYNQSDITNWSGYFDGSGDYLQTPSNSAFALGTGDYTVECWIYATSAPSDMGIYEGRSGGAATDGFTLTAFSSSVIRIFSGGVLVASSGTSYVGQWTHVAVTRASGTTTLWINGVSQGTSATSYNCTNTDAVIGGGRYSGGSSVNTYFPGYISNFRIVKGTAVYTSTFTPPTTNLTAVSGTSLLTCQNAAFTDNSTNKFVITPFGNSTVTGNSPFNTTGYWSNYFDGSGDYLQITSAAALQFGTGDFTVEFWLNLNARDINGAAIFNNYNSFTTGALGFFAGHVSGSTTKYQVAVNGTFPAIQSSTTVTYGQWNHFAIVRSGSTLTLYINGVADGTFSVSGITLNGVGSYWWLGSAQDAPSNYQTNGYLSNFRVVKGSAVYTSNFTVPTTPLTAISGTSLLTCQNGRFIDNSSSAFALTPAGNTSAQSFDPFYTATIASNGGSMYFDGSGDWLFCPSSPAFGLGTGDCTLEFWYYPLNRTVGIQTLFDLRTTNTAVPIALGVNASGYAYAYNGTEYNSSPTQVFNNAWNHIAFCRSGSGSNNCKLYLNGVQVNQFTDTSNWRQTNTFGFGRNIAYDGEYAYGYMAGGRIVKGAALYTANFTPPTAPQTPTAATTLLLNGMNAGIYDATAINDMETVGNAQVSTVQSKYGGSSVYFDGTDDRLVIPTTPQFGFGTGDYTIEFWLYMSALPGTKYTLLDFRTASTAQPHTVYVSSSGYMGFYNGSADVTSSSQPLSINTWYHVAYSRGSGTLKIFVAGTQAYSASNTIDYQATRPLSIGGAVGGIEVLNGYIDDLRITKGVARYTSNFTPPTQAFPPY